MLSSVPAGTMFGRSNENLNSRLDVIINKNKNSLIGKYFHINWYHCSPEVHDRLSVYTLYGKEIGLTNWGADYLYQVEEKTHDIAREIEELGLFSDEDLKSLKELGKKLLTDESVSDRFWNLIFFFNRICYPNKFVMRVFCWFAVDEIF